MRRRKVQRAFIENVRDKTIVAVSRTIQILLFRNNYTADMCIISGAQVIAAAVAYVDRVRDHIPRRD